MMGSLPVKNKNNTISNSAPIHEWWSTHAVVKLPFFQTETFYDIPCQVHKAQMDEALMLDGEPLAQQKHWISHKLGDKVVPKLHASIHDPTKYYARSQASAGRDLDSWPINVVN